MGLFLRNDFIDLEINKKSGAIIGIKNKKTGWQVISQPLLGMGIRLLVPFGNIRNNIVRGECQTLKEIKKINNNTVILRWDEVTGEKSGKLNIVIELKINIEEFNIIFEMIIENNSKYIVEEVWCPCLGGISNPAGEEELKSISLNGRGGLSEVKVGNGFGNRELCSPSGYWSWFYPTFVKTFPCGDTQTPFILLANGNQGIYIGVHDEKINIANFIHELKPGFVNSKSRIISQKNVINNKPAGVVISVARLPFIEQKEKYKLAPVIVNLFEGSWHNGLKPYLNWRKKWYKSTEQSRWYRDIDCWMTLNIDDPESTMRYRFNELPKIAKEAKEKGVGAIQITGWSRGGHDSSEPYLDINYRLGTKKELKEAIKKIEGSGIRIFLMYKFKWVDRNIKEFNSEIYPYIAKDMNDQYIPFLGYSWETISQLLEGGSRRYGAALCHLSKDLRKKILLREFKKLLSLGSSGALYDELISNFLLCFDTKHGHKKGECIFKGTFELSEELLNLAKIKNSNFVFAGEGPNDFLTQFYKISYTRIWDNSVLDEEHIPAWKYLNPEMQFAASVIGVDDRETINQCITFGYIINYEPHNFKGVISDIPKTVEYGQKAQKLRKKLWDYIWEGKFTHTVGAELKIYGDNFNYIYSVFENLKNNKKAIILSNMDNKKKLKALVKLKQETTKFEIHNIENEIISFCNGNVEVLPRSLIVLIEN